MKTSYESRLENAAETLDSSFQKSQIKVDSVSFLKQVLEVMGIDDSKLGQDTLEAETTTFKDFEEAFKQYPSPCPPIPRLKLAWSILKSSEKTSNEVAGSNNSISGNSSFSTLIQTIKPIGQWSDIELLEKYGRDCLSEVEEVLKKRSKDRNCIVFFEDGTVDVESSLYVFRKARYQETPSTFMFKDQTKQVFKVGEFPLDVLFECPIHRNVLLVDGYCEECAVKWDTKNTERLAFLRLTKEGTSTDPMMYKNMNFDQLVKEFPKIYIKFKELKDEDKLPSLKRRISRVKDGDPFRVSTHRSY
jgi:hypothetical protein